MGFPDNELASPISDVLRCPICMGAFVDPVFSGGSSCQHVFCRSCIAPALEQRAACPTCRAPLAATSLQTHAMTASLLDELQVYCTLSCGWRGHLDARPAHLQGCPALLLKEVRLERDALVSQAELLRSREEALEAREAEVERREERVSQRERPLQRHCKGASAGGKGAHAGARQQKGPQPVQQPVTSLTAEAVAAAPRAIQKQMLAEAVFPRVLRYQPDSAEKITRMMLLLDAAEILTILESEQRVQAKVEEAMRVLRFA